MANELFSDDDRYQNYLNLKEILDTGLVRAFAEENIHEAKGVLIEVQQHFRGLKLSFEAREELYNRLQEAFKIVNEKIDNEKFEFELETLSNFEELKPMTVNTMALLDQPFDPREMWTALLDLQELVRSKKLKREQRDELLKPIQDAFTLLKLQREDEKRVFERDASVNYKKLKALVDEGLKQAEESHEYKETREFLKKIQGEFKGIKMLSEQREELYSRLQTAFDILSKRLDDFFRNKKKNWETKMNYTLSRFDADIFELQQAVHKEKEYLEELTDQMDIMESAGNKSTGKLALQARISSAKVGIELKISQIVKLQTERDELKTRLE
jgi:hypothetical protein